MHAYIRSMYAFQSSFTLEIESFFNNLLKRYTSHQLSHPVPVAALSQVTRPEDRTRLMAWYNLFGCFSSALGAIFCGGVVAYLNGKVGISILSADRIVMILYSCVKVSQTFLDGHRIRCVLI